MAGEADCGTFFSGIQEVVIGFACIRLGVIRVMNFMTGSASHVAGVEGVADFFAAGGQAGRTVMGVPSRSTCAGQYS